MRNTRVKMIVEAGLVIAMSYLLQMIVLFKMPQGGSVKAASLVPLLFFAYRWGGKAGMLTGLGYGIIHFLLGFKYSIHPLSVCLDYFVAYSVIGVAGFFSGSRTNALLGGAVACFLRWCSTVVSGAVVFASYAPAGQNPWIYSMVYNATYMVPDMLINLVVLALLYNPLQRVKR